jgi:hypothetical protein
LIYTKQMYKWENYGRCYWNLSFYEDTNLRTNVCTYVPVILQCSLYTCYFGKVIYLKLLVHIYQTNILFQEFAEGGRNLKWFCKTILPEYSSQWSNTYVCFLTFSGDINLCERSSLYIYMGASYRTIL